MQPSNERTRPQNLPHWFWLKRSVTIRWMQSFNANSEADTKPARRTVIAGRAEHLPPGRCAAVDLSDGRELALYHVDGEYYVTDGLCPHRGAPLTEGYLRGHVIECALHGWQFDVRDGRCLTVSECVATYPVVVEDGVVKIEIGIETTGNDSHQ